MIIRKLMLCGAAKRNALKLRRDLEGFTDRRLPQQDGDASFKRVLGSTRTTHEASKLPQCHCRAEDDQRPHDRRHPNHRKLITEAAEGVVPLEQPGLHHISWGYRDEGGQTVHVSKGNGGRHTSQKEECQGEPPKPDPHHKRNSTPEDGRRQLQAHVRRRPTNQGSDRWRADLT